MTKLDEPRKLRPAISSDINTKKIVVDSLAIGKSSYDIEKDTGYPAATIWSYHRKNRESVEDRRKELEAIALDIIADLQFKTKTSLELSQHQYRLDIFPNHTNYKDNLDIVAFQNGSNLTKMQIKVLEKLGIFYSHTNLINQGNLTIKNQQNDQINHNIIKFTGEAASRRL